ncbi:L-rhamnose-binding lectin CSL3-like [Megalobrama amblycephala]|uniref:L-rhamnose-binding lectin CSL3-like n=1 Tax=Megalobrama amblycephala TaxID=75352 RepID=UPI002013D1ED|nr:L-rhamnose-binding lectin CSL3-like [Megalobrama amblycephala]
MCLNYHNSLFLMSDVGFIKVLKANYGRTDCKTCASGKPADQLSNTRCLAQSSLSTMSARCDGTKSCTIPAVNSVFSDPCYGTSKYLDMLAFNSCELNASNSVFSDPCLGVHTYLEVTYSCK